MDIIQIGRKVKERRESMRLTQAKLASLSKVSRMTVNALENGHLKEIGITKLLSIMQLLDMTMHFKDDHSPKDTLIQLTQSANVSYKHMLTPTIFKNALVKAKMPKKYIGNMMYFFDEAPEGVVNKTIHAVAALKKIEPSIIKNNAKKIAQDIKSPRVMWHDKA
jgi:transcriptional regulator with XRE-family HTH domain